MNEKNAARLIKHYKEEISKHIKASSPYRVSDRLKQMAALFSPGLFYYYVFNFHTLQMEYVHEGVEDVIGIKPEDFSIQSLLALLSQEEMKMMEKKELFVTDFLFNFLKPEEIPFYKVVYFLPLHDLNGNYRNILHQVITLSVSDSGKVKHVLGVHTDMSHLSLSKNDSISFISLNGKQSYFNLDPETKKFNPDLSSVQETRLSSQLTSREVEIIKLLAMGYSADKIAKTLHVSFNTVRTHRKNILSKTDCSNTTELVARCVVEGVI